MTAKDIALSELHTLQEIIKDVKDIELKALMKEINAAKRIFIGGAGRSLLSMKSFAMRLMQTGHETYLVGEVCTPSIQPGDLLIVGSSSGKTEIVLCLVKKAKSHGARTAVLTMHTDSPIALEANCVVAIKETPPIRDTDEYATVFAKKNMPGNFNEVALILVLDGIIGCLMEEKKQTIETIRYYHANLE